MATHLKGDYILLSKHRKGREQRGSPIPSSLPSIKPTLQINTQGSYCRDQGTADPANSSGCPLTSHSCHLLNSQSPAQRWVASTPLIHKSMTSLTIACPPCYFMVLLEPIWRARLWFHDPAWCQRAHSRLGSFSDIPIHPSNRNATKVFCGTLESIKMCCAW